MSKKNNSFKQEIISQYGQISRRLSTDIPSFSKIRNKIKPVSMNYGTHYPIARLFKHFDSLDVTLEQTLYSLQRLHKFSTMQASNVSEFYVSHYLYDFLTRVKTVTDLLALMVNYIFELQLEKKDCSLERGKLCNRLIKTFKNQDSSNNRAKQLGLKLDKARNDWLVPFRDLRDLIIHRAGIRFIGMAVPEVGQSHIHIASGEILRALHVADEREILSKFLAQVTPTSMSKYQTIDPVELCEQLWERLTKLVELVINECQFKIIALIDPKMQ